MVQCVVLSPHLDDAVLSCWSRLVRPQVDVVVTVFAGIPEPGTPLSTWDRLTRATDATDRGHERRREDAAALAAVGCGAVHLDLLGSSYRPAPLDGALLRRAVTQAVKGADELWVPAGIGGHPDHLAVRDAALDVAGPRRRILYADLPYAVRFGWPSWVTGERDGEATLDVAGWMAAQLPARLRLRARVHRLASVEAASKQAAMDRYRSQLAALTGGAALFALPSIRCYEVSWLVG